jgi:hypothetical protein
LTDNFVAHNIGPIPLRFTQSASKHRIGKGRAVYVLENYQPMVVLDGSNLEQKFRWVGKDQQGLELEIIAVATPQYLLVIHVMPNYYRRR